MLEVLFSLVDSKCKRMLREQKNSKNSTSNNQLFFSFYSKGQISMEMMSYYIILFGVFLVTLVLVVSSQRSIEEEKANMDSRRILIFAKNEIDIATNIGEGYSHSFFLPGSLQGGKDYDISISAEDQEIRIVYSQRNVTLPLLTNNITSTIKKGNNIVRNINGVVTIE